jgi:THO complex subunit 3
MTKGEIEAFKSRFSQCKGRDYRAHKASIHCVGWSADGKRVATAVVDGHVRIWSYEPNGKEYVDLKGHGSAVERLAWSPIDADNLLATASNDKTVRLWDAKSNERVYWITLSFVGGLCIQKISTGGENINLAWSPSGKVLAVTTKDDHIIFYDCSTPAASAPVLLRHKFQVEVNEFTWNPKDESQLLLTTGQGDIDVYRWPELTLERSLKGHTSGCYAIDFDGQGRRFAVGSADALTSVWDTREMACIATVGRLEWPVRSVSLSHDGLFVASASEDNFIDIAWVETGEQVCKVPSGVNVAHSVAWHPSKYILAFAGDEIDARSGRAEGLLRIFDFNASESSSTQK